MENFVFFVVLVGCFFGLMYFFVPKCPHCKSLNISHKTDEFCRDVYTCKKCGETWTEDISDGDGEEK